MKEIIKKWFDNPNEISLDDAIVIIKEYCKIYGNREVTDNDIRTIFEIHQNVAPIQFGKLIKYICIHYEYNIRELWSKPDPLGNRKLIRCYFDD